MRSNMHEVGKVDLEYYDQLCQSLINSESNIEDKINSIQDVLESLDRKYYMTASYTVRTEINLYIRKIRKIQDWLKMLNTATRDRLN